MNKIIFLVYRDLKNIIKTKGFWSGFLISLLYISIWIICKPKSFNELTYQYEYFRIVLFIFIYYSSVLLSREFSLGTSKTLFTGAFGRLEIIWEKIIVFLHIGLMFAIFSRLLGLFFSYWVNGYVNFSELFSIRTIQAILIYLLISFVIGSFGLLMASITTSFRRTLVINVNVFGIIQYFIPIFIFMNFQDKVNVVFQIVTKIPQYIILDWTARWTINGIESLTMLLWGSIFLISTLTIINRRSLR